jgi:ABC-type microcin C transport system duplicated ATPase subunit YejF
MKHGEIVEQGETEQIFLHPRENYTRTLIESGRKTSQAANL